MNAARLRVADYAVQAGKLDVYVTTSAVADATALAALRPVGTLQPSNATGFVLSFTYGAGDYFVTLTGSGNAADVRIFNEPISLGSHGRIRPAMSDLPDLPATPPGRYRHYKGGEYDVVGVARHSETLEALVVYRPLHGTSGLWVRPHAMFFGTVEVDGRAVPRFARIA